MCPNNDHYLGDPTFFDEAGTLDSKLVNAQRYTGRDNLTE